ncbi:RNA ligase family protein [Xanthomonas translucens pv. graminis]|uniref:RNA ligase family protein n=1 Tax=Xanthomonas graminis TaxID=3390026 RepID=UPI00253F74F9|nr:RNA ligase family protein [Xanthomonas translucens]WIH04881.1 RNA ligase family protein [Xanthomonas translucens pv. graminis]
MSWSEQTAAQVLRRDREHCVVCGQPARIVHELLDSRLWPGGVSPPGNLVVLCHEHKLAAESDRIAVNAIREAARIERTYPPQFYIWLEYDHWGNSLYSDGRRAMGELFDQVDVQQALAASGKIQLFGAWARYPRTFVLPWSEVTTAGDHPMESAAAFIGQRVVASEKLDGQNVTLYRDSFVFKSAWPRAHPSKEWLREFWEAKKDRIPDGWRVCGEFVYLTHTVEYLDLDSYFIGFSVWDASNTCLGWDQTSAFLAERGITRAPVLFDGAFDQAAIERAWRKHNRADSEGYVLRLAGPIRYRDFTRNVGKFIRAGFVQADFSNKAETPCNQMRTGTEQAGPDE